MTSTIAITGAAGHVGAGLRAELLKRNYRLRLLDRAPMTNVNMNETVYQVDILNRSELTRALVGADAVIHLAACTSDADWDEQISLSIQGTVNLYTAAHDAGVGRVVYASSNHVVGLHPRTPAVAENAILRPDSRYGVAKAFGESIGALYAFKYGMRVFNIRIGNANDRPLDRRRLGNWISWRDLGQLVSIGIEHTQIIYEIVYGISDSTGQHYDNRAAYALGYVPQDAPESFIERVLQDDPPPEPGSAQATNPSEVTLGGGFSAAEYVGGTQRLFASPLHERVAR